MNTENQQQQAEVPKNLKISAKYETIKLGIDWHAKEYRVVRIVDGSGPEPAQRFSPKKFLGWAQKQLTLAKKVYSCYEAGGCGFSLHRQLAQMGITNYVVVPRKLDPDQRRVCDDKTDARNLAINLELYLAGNHKAMKPVFVLTPEQEQKRVECRLREQLRRDRLAHAAQGRTLMLSQGYRRNNQWWKPAQWMVLQTELPAWLVESLSIYRQLILDINKQLAKVTAKIVAAAKDKARPVGMGALTLEQLQREVGDFGRFTNRKGPGCFVGLVGGVSSSGDFRCDLSITKAGHSRLRTIVLELAWRWVIYQPQCRLIKKWAAVLLGVKVHARRRKRAIVAVARQLFTDICRWQNGQATPEALGWKMFNETPAS